MEVRQSKKVKSLRRDTRGAASRVLGRPQDYGTMKRGILNTRLYGLYAINRVRTQSSFQTLIYSVS